MPQPFVWRPLGELDFSNDGWSDPRAAAHLLPGDALSKGTRAPIRKVDKGTLRNVPGP